MYPKLKHILMSQCLINRESQISFRKVESWLVPTKQPFDTTFSRNEIKKSSSALQLEIFRKVRKSAKKEKKMQFYSLNWSKFRTISKDEFERAKTPLAFIFLA